MVYLVTIHNKWSKCSPSG